MDIKLRRALSNLNVINWTDFYSWKHDYDNSVVSEFMKFMDEYVVTEEEKPKISSAAAAA